MKVMKKKEMFISYFEVSRCKGCKKIKFRENMHPAYPCPYCGERVRDGFSARCFFTNWFDVIIRRWTIDHSSVKKMDL